MSPKVRIVSLRWVEKHPAGEQVFVKLDCGHYFLVSPRAAFNLRVGSGWPCTSCGEKAAA